MRFSPDGSRLLTNGYPSGIVQIWDVASRTEARRIDTPPGYRGSADYALMSPDWKTLYVACNKRTVKNLEGSDGKTSYRIECSGKTRVWDVTTGKEKVALEPPSDFGPISARLSPDGRYLLCVEQPSYTAREQPRFETIAWDLEAGKRTKLVDGYAATLFLPDHKTIIVDIHDFEARKSAVKVLDLASGKELANLESQEKDRYLSIGQVSTDGALLATFLGGKKGDPLEVWFRDAKTLEDRGKLIGKADPERRGSASGQFAPDSRRYAVLDGDGSILVWNVSDRKLERTLPIGGNPSWGKLAFSPDGKTLAVGWMPRLDKEQEEVREPDPLDLPQPRVSLIDLSGNGAPRILMAPHGYVGDVAFSPDGKILAFGGVGAVHLFDPRSAP